MEFRVDPDTWFVFSILFISGLGLFIVGFITIPYILRKKQFERLQFKFYRKSDRYEKVEKKISHRRETQLEKNNQKFKSDLKISLREIIKNNRNEPETLTFFSDFEKIYPNFTSSLQEKIPTITPNEIKLCALLRMNLSAKEVSEILNITPESVNKARYRLRKKIGLQAKENLDLFLLNISSSDD